MQCRAYLLHNLLYDAWQQVFEHLPMPHQSRAGIDLYQVNLQAPGKMCDLGSKAAMPGSCTQNTSCCLPM